MAKFLLDTHVLMWLIGDPKSLSKKAHDIIVDTDSELYCSLINFWEIAIKVSIGKLDMSENWQAVYQQALVISDIKMVDIDPLAIEKVQHLPLYHRDPFDRMLLAQAMVNDLTFITADSKCHAYELNVVW